ncbi:MAG TPA: nucleotidyltransferase family protein [Verrucomicrobiae bacterium]|nr:nucleotidyltransferase family protein [Verrucomicrobiae bacterium]
MIGAVVLAAGRSERMGTQKLLLPLGGKPIITRVVDELSASQVDEIIVVVGRDGERLREKLAGKRVRVVENVATDSDMLRSLRCALQALPRTCEAAVVALGDQPGITHALVDELIRCFHRGESKIVLPSCQGHRGHPVLLGAHYFDEIISNHTATGLRGFLDAHSKEVLRVAVSEVTAMEDVDTPADYQRQKRLFEPGYAETVSLP